MRCIGCKGFGTALWVESSFGRYRMQRGLRHGGLTGTSRGDGATAEAGLPGRLDEDGIFNADFLSV